MGRLGYRDFRSFRRVINRAMTAFDSLGIAWDQDFVQIRREINGVEAVDYKLSRSACYFVAMNADTRKPEVARAQAYFVAIAQTFQRLLLEHHDVERVPTRAEITDKERSLSGIIKRSGVESYPLFQNAGYRGLYNMDLWRLRQVKGVPDKRSPLDFMGQEELAANLFRVTQTEARIRNKGISGQRALEQAAEDVGRMVRKTMIDTSGNYPEDLPPAEDIRIIKRELKSTHRKLLGLDSNKK